MAEETTATMETTETKATDNTQQTESQQKVEGTEQKTEATNNSLTAEAIEKIIQSKVDKLTAQLGKEKAAAVEELEKLKKDKMTADELQKYELDKEKQALAEREKELADKTKRLTAINELTKIEMYDGSENANTLLGLFVNGAKDETEIVDSVNAFKAVVDKIVAAQVDKTFRTNGRVPNGGDRSGEVGKDNKNSFAAELGKKKAEAAKKSNEILDLYYGGKK